MEGLWSFFKTYVPCLKQRGLEAQELEEVSKITKWSTPEVKQRYIYFKQYSSGDEMNKEEFCNFFKNQMRGFSKQNLARLFRAADTSKNRSLSFSEVAELMRVIEKGHAEDRLDLMWRVFDSEGAGFLLDSDEEALIEHMKGVSEMLGQDEKSSINFIQKTLLSRTRNKKDQRITKEKWMSEGSKYPSFMLFLGYLPSRTNAATV